MDEMKRLREILDELDRLDHAVGRSMEDVCMDRCRLLQEGLRLLAKAVLELGGHTD